MGHLGPRRAPQPRLQPASAPAGWLVTGRSMRPRRYIILPGPPGAARLSQAPPAGEMGKRRFPGPRLLAPSFLHPLVFSHRAAARREFSAEMEKQRTLSPQHKAATGASVRYFQWEERPILNSFLPCSNSCLEAAH